MRNTYIHKKTHIPHTKTTARSCSRTQEARKFDQSMETLTDAAGVVFEDTADDFRSVEAIKVGSRLLLMMAMVVAVGSVIGGRWWWR